MIFITDENISSNAARMLDVFDPDNEIRSLDTHFVPGTRDTTWIRKLSQWNPKPIVICGDGRILRNSVEQSALRKCNLMFVYLKKGWTNLAWLEFAWKIIKVWPQIVRNVQNVREPSLFAVTTGNLKIELVGPISKLGK